MGGLAPQAMYDPTQGHVEGVNVDLQVAEYFFLAAYIAEMAVRVLADGFVPSLPSFFPSFLPSFLLCCFRISLYVGGGSERLASFCLSLFRSANALDWRLRCT